MLGAADVAVFDANTDEVYARAHVPGAVHLDEYRRYPAATLPADKASRVVFYCKNTH
ncbi:MAG TPA: rhodanese-like domain-containing protein [Anaeromyxobacteraceae bacterium]|nr:rhodanese-like domain-containing protein [Anaeromyxobacteraceae bacterium]